MPGAPVISQRLFRDYRFTFVGFNDKKKAIDFEKYLKSGSGRAFREKRF